MRAALGEQPAVAALGQGIHRGLQVDGLVAGDDDVRVPGQLGPPAVRGRLGAVITIVRACAGAAAISGLSGSRSSRRVTTAIGGVGGRPSRR